jgi:hypothetical protein
MSIKSFAPAGGFGGFHVGANSFAQQLALGYCIRRVLRLVTRRINKLARIRRCRANRLRATMQKETRGCRLVPVRKAERQKLRDMERAGTAGGHSRVGKNVLTTVLLVRPGKLQRHLDEAVGGNAEFLHDALAEGRGFNADVGRGFECQCVSWGFFERFGDDVIYSKLHERNGRGKLGGEVGVACSLRGRLLVGVDVIDHAAHNDCVGTRVFRVPAHAAVGRYDHGQRLIEPPAVAAAKTVEWLINNRNTGGL